MKGYSRCSGHCCRAFILSVPLPVIRERVAAGSDDSQLKFIAENFFEIGILNPTVMLIKEERFAGASQMLHSCRKYNHETGSCMAYDERPRVCRDHPEYDDMNRKCKYEGCTYNQGAMEDATKMHKLR